MPVLLGMFLGILIAVGCAFAYDTVSGRAPTDWNRARPAAGHRWSIGTSSATTGTT